MRFLVRSLAVAALLGGCMTVTRVPLVNAPGAPAADGSVLVSAAPNGNTRLSVEVKHLAPPERLAPGAKVYVAWTQARGGQPQNVGAIVIDDNRSGRLETVTPLPTFELFITAEGFPTAAVPSGPRVLFGVVEQ